MLSLSCSPIIHSVVPLFLLLFCHQDAYGQEMLQIPKTNITNEEVATAIRNGSFKFSSVTQAASRGTGAVVEDWLRGGGSVDETDQKGNTVLIISTARCAHAERLVEYLLKDGLGRPASINLQNIMGMSALMVAAAYNQYPCAARLIEAGADKKLRDLKGRSALQIAQGAGATEVETMLLESGAEDADTIQSGEDAVEKHIEL
eukprot:CAMPEP_0194284536 /NCGR_PEP_ID=MMETSP0169-20130528/27839_1 /TAXON_ID=218684 /ORGANISM="Corethron pennatum, Strain L29A3" /LENGTH=202 /DNA_ID=CAMNT_0039030377 /DNA_START=48 /DNA_END=656 /DNA_ORIENTATION=-